MACRAGSSSDQTMRWPSRSVVTGNPAACRASRSRYTVRVWHSTMSARSGTARPCREAINAWMIFHCRAS